MGDHQNLDSRTLLQLNDIFAPPWNKANSSSFPVHYSHSFRPKYALFTSNLRSPTFRRNEPLRIPISPVHATNIHPSAYDLPLTRPLSSGALAPDVHATPWKQNTKLRPLPRVIVTSAYHRMLLSLRTHSRHKTPRNNHPRKHKTPPPRSMPTLVEYVEGRVPLKNRSSIPANAAAASNTSIRTV